MILFWGRLNHPMEYESNDKRKVILHSQEGDAFEVEWRVVKISNLITTMTETDSDGTVAEIPLPIVKSHVLSNVLSFCHHYDKMPMSRIPRPIPWPKRVSDFLDEWYSSYCLLMPYELLFQTIAAANYLDIPPLLELCCARLGRLLMNKTPDEVKELFKFEDAEFSTDIFESLKTNIRWSTETVSLTDMDAEPPELISRLRAYVTSHPLDEDNGIIS